MTAEAREVLKPFPQNTIRVEFSAKIDADEIARMRPDRAEALMAGLAKVMSPPALQIPLEKTP